MKNRTDSWSVGRIDSWSGLGWSFWEKEKIPRRLGMTSQNDSKRLKILILVGALGSVSTDASTTTYDKGWNNSLTVVEGWFSNGLTIVKD